MYHGHANFGIQHGAMAPRIQCDSTWVFATSILRMLYSWQIFRLRKVCAMSVPLLGLQGGAKGNPKKQKCKQKPGKKNVFVIRFSVKEPSAVKNGVSTEHLHDSFPLPPLLPHRILSILDSNVGFASSRGRDNILKGSSAFIII